MMVFLDKHEQDYINFAVTLPQKCLHIKLLSKLQIKPKLETIACYLKSKIKIH